MSSAKWSSAVVIAYMLVFVLHLGNTQARGNDLPELQRKIDVLQTEVQKLKETESRRSSILDKIGLNRTRTYHESSGETSFAWQTAGGNYADPSSFFFLHGYVTAVMGSFVGGGNAQDATNNPLPAPAQLGLPNPAGNTGFASDWALFLGSEISETIKVIYEHHWVRSGNGNKITEMNVQWSPLKDLWITGGLYWAPFGTVNHDWLQAQNLFATIPHASRAIPFHSNVAGIRMNWHRAFNDSAGVNLVVSVDNGASGMSITQQDIAGDSNDHKQVQGRLGIFPGLGNKLNLGYSFAAQTFRTPTQARANRTGGTTATNPLSYPAVFSAHGVDMETRLIEDRLKVRGYYINSREDLEGDSQTAGTGASFSAAGIGSLLSQGLMGEASYVFLKDVAGIKTYSAKVRYDQAWVDLLATSAGSTVRTLFNDRVISFGLEANPHEHMRVSLEYHYVEELGRTSIDNNGIVFKMTGEF